MVLLAVGLLPVASATKVNPKFAPPPSSRDILAHPDLMRGEWEAPLVVYLGGTPQNAFQSSDPISSKVAFALLDPLRAAPRDGEDEAWLFHALHDLPQGWEHVVVVAQIRQIRTFAHPTYLALLDGEEMGAEEIDTPIEEPQPAVQAPGSEPRALLAVPDSAARFAPQTATFLTLGIGLLGLSSLRPKQLPGKRRAPQ